MADRTDPRRPDGPDADLVAELRELGRRLDVPAGPDLRSPVRARLAGGPAPARVRLGPGWSDRSVRLAAALIAFAVLVAGTLAASPRARAAVLEFWPFGAIRVHTGAPPVPLPTTGPAGPSIAGLPPDTRETTLADAQRTAVFPVAVPAALGPPDQVLVRGDHPAFVALRYGQPAGRPQPAPTGTGGRPGTIELDELAGTLSPYLDKYVATGGAERVTVGTATGLWIDSPHEVVYVDESGATRFESARLAGRTLIWQLGGVTLRLEGALTRGQALAIAQSAG
jgi:hypothetical protein